MLTTFKNLVIYIRVIVSFVLLRAFGNIINDIAQKYGSSLDVKDLRKLERLQIKVNKAKLDINFLKNCESFQVYPKFVYFVRNVNNRPLSN